MIPKAGWGSSGSRTISASARAWPSAPSSPRRPRGDRREQQCSRAEHRPGPPRLDDRGAEQGALRVAPAGIHRSAGSEAGRCRGRRRHRSDPRRGFDDRRQQVLVHVEGRGDLAAPGARGKVEQHRLAGVRGFGGELAGEAPGHPVAEGQHLGDRNRVGAGSVDQQSRERRDERRPVSADPDSAFEREPAHDLHGAVEAASVHVRARVDLAPPRIEKHAAEALRTRRDSGDGIAPHARLRQCCARAARERGPEGVGVDGGPAGETGRFDRLFAVGPGLACDREAMAGRVEQGALAAPRTVVECGEDRSTVVHGAPLGHRAVSGTGVRKWERPQSTRRACGGRTAGS